MSAGSAAAMENAGSGNPEKDIVVFGGLFQTIINDLRSSSPIWEEFTYKSVKLHASLKTTVVAVGAFLEAFQKVADMATSSKGATREIGSALTRLCMRHRSIETHLKALTSSILDNLVAPLQDKLEDWKKAVVQLDKDHSKESKKAKQDIKKAASDTIRLQKKVRKGSTHGKSDTQQKLDTAMIEVNSKYHQLEETEKSSVRSALIEERSRFCLFISCLKPFVDQELKLLTEMTHINEIMENLCMQANEPAVLPASSEQVILDLKGIDATTFNFTQAYQQSSPPSSPSSLGSRKSSMCSINSNNSGGSSGSSHSPSHTIHKHHHHHTYAQPPPSAVRLTSVSSQDSGFTSQDTLFQCHNVPQSLSLYQGADAQDRDDCDSTPTTPSDNMPSASSTWNNWPNLPGNPKTDQGRPHTISSAYEKGHSRPALKPHMFEPPLVETVEMRPKTVRSQSQTGSRENRPSATISKLQPVLPPHCPKPKMKAVAPPMLPPGAQPIYANTSDLALRGSPADLSPDDGEPTTPTTPASTSMSLGTASSELTGSSQSLVGPPVQRMTALEQAMEQMDLCTASLNLGSEEQNSSGSQHTTPRSSTDDLSGGQTIAAAAAPAIVFPVVTGDVAIVLESPRVKLQQNTSLELAKAIRELEASTAALTSAYDSETYAVVSNHAVVTSSAATATCDADSYTSKMSLQCSSGYGTMNSTPAGSEDTIASGGVADSIAESSLYEELEEVIGEDCHALASKFDSEKYYTIPRSGEMRAAYRAAMQYQRPASTTGIPIAGAGVGRRSSVNSQKPPPPVRRTASVSGIPHLQSGMDKVSPADGQDSTYAAGGGEGLVESPYAELQVIQQSIIYEQSRVQSGPGMSPKTPHYQRQTSAGDKIQVGMGYSIPPDESYMYAHDTGVGGQYNQPQGQAINAKLSSLGSQYQEDHVGGDAPDSSVGASRGLVQKPAPQVMQKPNRNAFPPPPSVMLGHAGHHQVAVSSGLSLTSQHPQQGSHPLQGGHPPQQGGHAPQQGIHHPQQGIHHPQQGSHSAIQGSYPLQQGSHPLQQGNHPQQGSNPQQGSHPLQQGSHPLQQGSNPQQGSHPLQQGSHPLQQGSHPLQQGSHHPQQGIHYPIQGGPHHGHQPHQHIQHQLARQIQQQKQQQLLQQQGFYSEPAGYQQHARVLPAHPEEDFPLPPTQEELQEIERAYSLQQPLAGPIVRAPVQFQKQVQQMPATSTVQQLPLQHHQQLYHPRQQHLMQQHHQVQLRHQQQQQQPLLPQTHPLHPQQHHLHQQPRHQLQQPQDVQASLLMELKKRVSVDETSEA